MKTVKVFHIILMILLSVTAVAQLKAKVYIIRATNQGAGFSFRAFIDNNLACKLFTKEYSIHEIDTGTHSIAVQYYGSTQKAKANKIEINAEAGKTYFIEMVYIKEYLNEKLFCQQITPESATQILLPLCTIRVNCL